MSRAPALPPRPREDDAAPKPRVAGANGFNGRRAVSPVAAALRGRVVALIPALDEAENIRDVVHAIPAFVDGVPTRTLVVDDGSTDGTGDVAKEAGALVVRNATCCGGGAALRTGYELAVRAGARVVVTLDGDGQHLPSEIPALVAPVLSGEADMVVGSRVLGSAEPGPVSRKLGIAVFNVVVSVLTARKVTDCSNSFRAIRTDALAELDLRQDQFHAAEALIEALTRGMRVIEMPVTVARRQHGHTKKPRTLRYGVGFGRAIAGAWLRSLTRRPRTSRRNARTRPEPERSAA